MMSLGAVVLDEEWEKIRTGFDVMRFRVGRKTGRTVYVQVGAEPSDQDVLIGLMDTAGIAQLVVDALNRER